MFDTLSDRLNDVFDRLRRHGALSEDDVGTALREIRIALLEADVALPVVRDFVKVVREKAIGQEVLRSVTPGQMGVKIVHEHLGEVLGGDQERRRGDGIDLNATPPVGIMLVGLQGSGKTTTCAKIALRLKNRERKKVLMASLDVQRPAAQEQLAQLGRQIGVTTLPVAARIESAAPPRPSPSTRVRTMPEISTRASNERARFTASWPVSASATSRISCGLTAAFTAAVSCIRSSSTWVRPAVSKMTTS
jgi:signal recognition particle subunit SRP54